MLENRGFQPCPECGGTGCDECDLTGFDVQLKAEVKKDES